MTLKHFFEASKSVKKQNSRKNGKVAPCFMLYLEAIFEDIDLILYTYSWDIAL